MGPRDALFISIPVALLLSILCFETSHSILFKERMVVFRNYLKDISHENALVQLRSTVTHFFSIGLRYNWHTGNVCIVGVHSMTFYYTYTHV